jgi:hypothetical protein
MNQNKKPELGKNHPSSARHLPLTDKIRRFPFPSHGGFSSFGSKIRLILAVWAE